MQRFILLFFFLLSSALAEDNLTLWMDINEKEQGLHFRAKTHEFSTWGWVWRQPQRARLGIRLPLFFLGPLSLSGLYQRVDNPDLVYAWSSSLGDKLEWNPNYGPGSSRIGVRFDTDIFSTWMWQTSSNRVYGVDFFQDLGQGLQLTYLFAGSHATFEERRWYRAFERLSDVQRSTLSLQYHGSPWLVLGEYDFTFSDLPGQLFRGAFQFSNTHLESGLHLSYLNDTYRLWYGTRAKWDYSVSAYIRSYGQLQSEVKAYVQRKNDDFISDSEVRSWLSSSLSATSRWVTSELQWKSGISFKEQGDLYELFLDVKWKMRGFQLWGRGQWESAASVSRLLSQKYTIRIQMNDDGVVSAHISFQPDKGVDYTLSVHLPVDRSVLSVETQINVFWRRSSLKWHLKWKWSM